MPIYDSHKTLHPNQGSPGGYSVPLRALFLYTDGRLASTVHYRMPVTMTVDGGQHHAAHATR